MVRLSGPALYERLNSQAMDQNLDNPGCQCTTRENRSHVNHIACCDDENYVLTEALEASIAIANSVGHVLDLDAEVVN